MKTKYVLFLILLLGVTSCKEIASYILSAKTKIEGTYVNDKSLVGSVTFKGKSTVIVNMLGFDLAGDYEKDGDLIKINVSSYDLLFEIITEDSLVGKGFIEKGSYIKIYK